MRRALVFLAAAIGIACATALPASAHPLGNFTINQYSGVRIYADAIVVDLVTDEAELPTVQARGDIDVDHDGTVDDTEAASWAARACTDAANHTTITVDGHPLAVRPDPTHTITFPPGQAALATLRLECSLRADATIGAGSHDLAYRNTAFDGRIGWHEIVVAPDGITVSSADVASTGVTDRLTHYPTDQLRSPLAQRSAAVTFALTGATTAGARTVAAAPGAAVTALLPRGADRASRAFTDLVARRRLTLAFGVLATMIALVLGAFHALAPGHGKTVMAAYVVGQRGTLRQAGLIGLTVTATHTAGVAVLGVVLTTSTVIAPERLYPWLGLASGLLLASIGVTLARRALRLSRVRRAATPSSLVAEHALVAVGAAQSHAYVDHQDHGHDHHDHHDHHEHDHHEHDHHEHEHEHDHDHHEREREHDHDHDDHDHDHGETGMHAHGGWAHSHPSIDPALGWRSLVAVGFAGGLVPSPSALLVLLGAIALGRTWFGLVLVTAYGVGMAATLAAAGLLLVRARNLFERRAALRRRPSRSARLARFLPLATSTIIIAVGLTLAARAALKI